MTTSELRESEVKVASSETPSVPRGWLLRGSHPQDYEAGTADGSAGGTVAAYLRARPKPGGFGTLMQMFTAQAYRGTRQRLSARLRSADVAGWAGLWMRVDGPAQDTLAFDNMATRPIKGTTGWTGYDVVLDVAPEATHVAFGVLLNGGGCAWIEDITLTTVGDDVPTTDTNRGYPDRPTNLDFTE